MHLIHGSITTTGVAQPIVPAAVVPDRILPFQQFIFQNNGSHNMRLGDSSVSSTQGLLIFPTGSNSISPALQYSGDMSEFYVEGTAGDTYDCMILD
jgi:hypothetical protein